MAKSKNWTLSDLKNRKGIRAVNMQGKGKANEDVTTIVFSDKIHGLNGPEGLIREHWAKAIKKKKTLCWLIMEQTRAKYKGPVKVTFTNYACQLKDWDNFCASFKHIGDSLIKCGVIEEDNPEIIRIFLPKQERVKKRSNEMVTVQIEPFKE